MARVPAGAWSGLLAAGAVALTLSATAALGQERTDAAVARAPFVPGHALVRYAPGVTAAQRAAARRAVGATSARPVGVARAELLRLGPGRPVASAVAGLASRPGVELAQPDWIYQLDGVPNDPEFGQQWGLHNTGQTVNGATGAPDADVDAPEAWDVTTGSDSVIVGVIDTGVNVRHPDLAPNLFVNAAEAGGILLADDDANGRTDDVNGFDFRNVNAFVSDDALQHGTLVASVIGARGADAAGVTGMAQRVKILPLQAVTDLGGISTAAAADAIAYARQMGARVVNMSFGSYGLPDGGDDVIRLAIEASPGILFTTSAGNLNGGAPNDNDVTHHWPSNLTRDHANVIAVANTTSTDALAPTSSFGATTVDLAAPGTNALGAGVPTGSPLAGESFDSASPGTLPSGWEAEGGWTVTSERSASGANSLTDSPGADYANGSDTWVASAPFAPPSDATFCVADARLRLRLGDGADVLGLEASIAEGPFFRFAELDADTPGTGLSPLLSPGFRVNGTAPTRVRFRLQTDADLPADGVHVDDFGVRCGPTTDPTLRFSSGTSFSAPLVAGVAALMLAREPALTPAQLKAGLRASVDLVPGLTGRVATGGRVNASRAVGAVEVRPEELAPAPPAVAGAPAPDARAPVVSGVAVTPSAFLAMASGPLASLASPALPAPPFRPVVTVSGRRGARLRFQLDETAAVTLSVRRGLPGRRVGPSCLRPSRANRRRGRCLRWAQVGAQSLGTLPAGLARPVLRGRAGGRALAPGLHRVELVAVDGAGNRSRPRGAGFRILAPPRRAVRRVR